MTYKQIWNTVEDLFNQNLILAKEANKFFGILNYEADEVTSQDGLVIKRKRKVSQENKRREGLYQISFNTHTKNVEFRINKFDDDTYELVIPGLAWTPGGNHGIYKGVGNMTLDPAPDDMKHFIKYVRDWKLKNLLD